MSVESPTDRPARPALWASGLIWLLGAIVVVYLLGLAVEIALRVRFPWDLFLWPESPFMTNMLKMDLGQPIFGPPADGNSFVYSPGLEYITYAVLKPLGLNLDIRFCRLVNVGIGILAALLATQALKRAIQGIAPENRFRRLHWLGGGIAALVLFRNFTSDVPHPDNLVMFHTAGVIFLTLWAWQEKNFAVAIAVMLFAGMGVFAKQILAVAFVGPSLVFLRFNPWGWRKSVALAVLGGLSAVACVVNMTWSPDARFYLLQLLPRQGIHLTRLYWMTLELVQGDRAMLLVLGLISLPLCWQAGAAGRNYFQFWLIIGIFSVLPNMLSYIKTMGTWNNLIIVQLWLVFLVVPAIAFWASRSAREVPGMGAFHWLTATVLLGFVLLLMPPKTPAHPLMYQACEEIQRQVNEDVKAGRRILVGHGLMYLLHAGVKQVPLDRVNSILELKAAGLESRSEFPERIRQHYYDKLYIVVEDWYPPEFVSLIKKYYRVESVVPRPSCSDHAETGRYVPLIADCQIIVPRNTDELNSH